MAAALAVATLVPAVASAQGVAPADAKAFMGGWSLGLETPQGAMTMNLTLKDANGKVAGSLTSDLAPDPQAITDGVCGLLDQPDRLEKIRHEAYAMGRDMIWPAVAKRYVDFARSRRAHAHRGEETLAPTPQPISRRFKPAAAEMPSPDVRS
jgi:hypothetical protein